MADNAKIKKVVSDAIQAINAGHLTIAQAFQVINEITERYDKAVADTYDREIIKLEVLSERYSDFQK